MRWRFEGEIAGLGSTSGLRVVVGHWSRSPFGAFSDVMVERPDGHRLLLAPTRQVADFVASAYVFDEVVLTPVLVQAAARAWTVETDQLVLRFALGRRTPLGWLLRAVPGPVARSTRFAAAVDPVARVVLRGVRTRGTSGSGRREWYGARDVRRIVSLSGHWQGREVGDLRPVRPPVRFGFGSTPPRPSVTRLVSTVETA